MLEFLFLILETKFNKTTPTIPERFKSREIGRFITFRNIAPVTVPLHWSDFGLFEGIFGHIGKCFGIFSL